RDVYQNILGIMDNTGAIMVKYSCDAWGNHKVLDGNGNENISDSFIGNINPFRYKGYYYDKESNMYYCKSRYYVPEWCRWLNADSIGFLDPKDISSMNLFSYCSNNPVMFSDEDGDIAISTLVCIIVGLIALATIGMVTYGAITDTPIAIDFSFSAGLGAGVGGKVGISIVLDFKNNCVGFYPHYGYFLGMKYNTIGFSYGVGIISNYENDGDYQGPFVDMGGGYLAGIDHCYDPRYSYDATVKASSVTFGNNKGVYYGEDYYGYWGSFHLHK
ncbi:MAG: RHS repeat-associated core domain-containing protein, partial [Anaeroplasmataceae bacterium]|nr:RHS repeat-associated core domain-containing protein [Anaeroplasmataceae bacterium]